MTLILKIFVLYSDVYVNWTDGTEICRRTHRSAQLVAIETEAEQEYLKEKWMVERGWYLRFSYPLHLDYIQYSTVLEAPRLNSDRSRKTA